MASLPSLPSLPSFRSASLASLVLLSGLASCGGAKSPNGAAKAAGSAEKGGAHAGQMDASLLHSHWVARTATSQVPFGMSQAVHGPIRNNFGTQATAYLAKGKVGILDGGKRYIFTPPSTATPVAGDSSEPLTGVLGIDEHLGGGFVFTGPNGLYVGPTFDGHLFKVAPTASAYGGLVPHGVLLDNTGVVGTADGIPMKGVPKGLHRSFAHPAGFAVATTAKSTYFTADGKHWRPLSVGAIKMAGPDGPRLTILTVKESKSLAFVDPKGITSTTTPTPDEMIMRAMRLAAGTPDERPLGDAYEGALLDAGFVPTGRAVDEWFGVASGHLELARTGAGTMTAMGSAGTAGDANADCAAQMLDGVPSYICTILGKHLSENAFDLEKQTSTAKRVIDVTKGTASFLGRSPGTYPATLLATASCDGDATSGLCVRGNDGAWASVAGAPAGAETLAFPGEAIFVSTDKDGNVQVSGSPATTRSFTTADMQPVHTALGMEPAAAGAKPKLPPFVTSAVLRTRGGLRYFYVPSPLDAESPGATTATAPVSYYVDMPLASLDAPTATKVDGLVAAAGAHALRLSGGKLWETNDGWTSWYEVPPPPTGMLQNLDGAMCTENGCLVGGWARIGWER